MAKTILLADDSSTIRRIVELTFSDTEYRVETADSGATAMEKLKALRPDLVLADVVMPGPTGYEICKSIKQSDRPVPVVLLAGTFEPFDENRAQDCGADAHLVKPFESDLLREKVASLIAEAEAAAAAAAEPEPVAEAAAEPQAHLTGVAVEIEIDEALDNATSGEALQPGDLEVSPELVEALARAVVEKLSADVLREIAWDVVPDLARTIIRERIRELEQEDS